MADVKMVKVDVLGDDDIGGTEYNLLSYQRAVQEWIDEVPEEHRGRAVIEYRASTWDECGADVCRTISYYRPETEEDREEERRRQQNYDDTWRQRELAEYERLKAKYG